jgi:hypothetical protein
MIRDYGLGCHLPQPQPRGEYPPLALSAPRVSAPLLQVPAGGPRLCLHPRELGAATVLGTAPAALPAA